MVDFPWEEGVLEGENHTQINIYYPPRILQVCGQVCLIKNTCWKSSKFFVFNCIYYGTLLLRERLPLTFETSKQTRVYACKNNHEIRQPNSTSNHNRELMEK